MSEPGKYLWLYDEAYPVHWSATDRGCESLMWEEKEVKILSQKITPYKGIDLDKLHPWGLFHSSLHLIGSTSAVTKSERM